jgi:hypothetical protein
MTNPNMAIDVTTDAMAKMILPRVEIAGVGSEKSAEKINAIAFELYKESLSIVNFVAHLIDELASLRGGWPRNQAICAGLMVRISKFMRVVMQLSATRDRAEVVCALNRSIMESAINLEFLVRTNDEKYFDQFVKLCLGPERELYDLINTNVSRRNGEVWPIEQGMLESINDVCQASGVKIDDVHRKQVDWGGNLRQRLEILNKEDQYVGMQRIPSHAVHGTWVDLYQNHLQYDSKTQLFSPDNRFTSVDERIMGPIANLVLEAIAPYVERFFPNIPESTLVLERIADLHGRIHEVGAAHQGLMTKA